MLDRFVFGSLFVLSLVLLGVAYWHHGDAETIRAVEHFVKENNGVIIGVGTIILLSVLAFYSTSISNIASDRRELFNRRVQSELKIAEFRQAWINSLRDDMADYIAWVSFGEGKGRSENGDLFEGTKLGLRIQLRLNPTEDGSKGLLTVKERVTQARFSGNATQERLASEEFALIGQKLLKSECSRLKSDLKNAQALQEKIP